MGVTKEHLGSNVTQVCWFIFMKMYNYEIYMPLKYREKLDGDNHIFILHYEIKKLVLMVNMETTARGNATSTVELKRGVTE